MKRKLGRRRRGSRKPFLLNQILRMKPYILGLMRDLRALRIRRERLKLLVSSAVSGTEQSYQERKRRHEANAELAELEQQELSLIREFRKSGVRVGNVLRGEMLFGCLVDNQEAYFIWFDGEDRPAQWRFRGEAETNPIPDRWFSLFSSESQSLEEKESNV